MKCTDAPSFVCTARILIFAVATLVTLQSLAVLVLRTSRGFKLATLQTALFWHAGLIDWRMLFDDDPANFDVTHMHLPFVAVNLLALVVGFFVLSDAPAKKQKTH